MRSTNLTVSVIAMERDGICTPSHLTPTGLLMEGDYTHNLVVGEMAIIGYLGQIDKL